MAYRKSKGKLSRRSKKIEPAVQTMLFQAPAVAANSAAHYIDLSQSASLVNRRFYRQGINWAVSKITIYSQTFAGQVVIAKLPETWTMSNAWEKSFRSWQEMNEKALEDTESVRPRFMDFKIYADDGHHNVGFAGNLLPISAANPPVVATAGEWESSKISIPTSGATGVSTDFEMIATGASFQGASPVTTLDAVSLIEGYAASRGLPYTPDPNVPDDAEDVGPTATPENWMGALNNEGTDQDKEVLDRMVGTDAENNQAPYPFENGRNPAGGFYTDTHYPGGANQLAGLQVHSFELLTPTTVGGQTTVKGGMFPCGLMKIEAIPDSGNVPILLIQVDLVPGHHRGYLCEPMTEM
jgi:hypothetical protein